MIDALSYRSAVEVLILIIMDTDTGMDMAMAIMVTPTTFQVTNEAIKSRLYFLSTTEFTTVVDYNY